MLDHRTIIRGVWSRRQAATRGDETHFLRVACGAGQENQTAPHRWFDKSFAMTALIICIVLGGGTSCFIERGEFANFDCPEGTVVFGNAPPIGVRRWCAKMTDSTRSGFMKHGIWRFFWSNGKLSQEGFYDNDRKQGEFKTWDRNGTKRSEGSYEKDKKQGEWREWHKNGKLKSLTVYYQDMRVGKQLLYTKEGEVSDEITYRNGAIIDWQRQKQGTAAVK